MSRRRPSEQTRKDHLATALDRVGHFIQRHCVRPIGQILHALQQIPVIKLLWHPGFYIYTVWAMSTSVIIWGEITLTRSNAWILTPLVLNLGILVASIRNQPFPLSPQVPRFIWSGILFATYFLQQANVTQYSYRPYWTNMAFWIVGVTLGAAIFLNSYTLGLSALITLVMSFSSLLV